MARKPISAKTRYLILERDNFTCQCCGGAAPNVTLHVDHIKPVAAGGTNDHSNLRAVCVTCNVGKGAMPANVVSVGQVEPQYPIRTADNEVVCRGDPLGEPIFWIGRQWAVTSFGVECRDGTYFIEAKNLWQDEPEYSWEKHMAEKEWVDHFDFNAAMKWARNHFIKLRKRA